MFGERKKENKVFLPVSMISRHYIGELYGIYHNESGVFNVYDEAMLKSGISFERIGVIADDSDVVEGLVGKWVNDELSFNYNNETLKIESYQLINNVFSRNYGILESEVMLEKTAIIIGCGSVGSLVALELTKAGVGNFLLIDNDIFEYHNICRHQCGISDVGMFKTHALRKRILQINPYANIVCENGIIETVNKDILDFHCILDKSIIIGCADNRTADVYANSLSIMYSIPFVSIGFWERAFAGEIFYHLPNYDMPCYKCALGSGSNLSNRKDSNRRFYTNEYDLSKVNFEPGISIDINFVTIIGIKIIIDILNISNPNYTVRVLDSLQQYTLVCNSNKAELGGELAGIFSYPLQVTTSLKVSYGNDCPPCKFK